MTTIPHRLANGIGNKPDADQYMGNWDWLTAIAIGSLIQNGGMENWNGGVSFVNPADATELADDWLYEESGATPAIATVTRESSTIDTETYSMKIDLTTGGSSDSDILIEQSVQNVQRFSSRTVLFGARIFASSASKVRVRISDGVSVQYSSFHTGGGSWELLQVQLTVDGTPTEIKVSIAIDPADFTGAVYADSIHLYDIPSQISSTGKAALGYIALVGGSLNLAGGVMSGGINMGGNAITNQGDLAMGGNDILNAGKIAVSTVAPSTPVADTIYKDSIIKGWILFNGLGTVSIYDDMNVTSLADTDTGDYTITWETDLASANYAILGTGNAAVMVNRNNASSSTAGISYILVSNSSADPSDSDLISIAIVGD